MLRMCRMEVMICSGVHHGWDGCSLIVYRSAKHREPCIVKCMLSPTTLVLDETCDGARSQGDSEAMELTTSR